MNFLKSLFLVIFTLSVAQLNANENEITNEKISEITERLETYSIDQLSERRDFLINYQEDTDEDEDSNGVPIGSRAERNLEISIIEALLVALGVVIADNISEDSSTPPDTVFPIITILGDNPATVELGSTYSDAGATTNEGTISVVSNNVNPNIVGSYSIVYSATDAAGNTSTSTRTVNVVDTTAPVLTVTGDNPVTAELGTTYTDAGATATDLDTVTVTSTSDVDTSTIGSYTVTYTATDASGNSATAIRTVIVVDTSAPTITSPSSFSVVENQTSIGTIEVDDADSVTFTVTGSDNIVIDQNGVLSFVTAPDYETLTEYVITVTVTDASGNLFHR